MSDMERLVWLGGCDSFLAFIDIASSYGIALDKVPEYLRDYDETLRVAFS